MATLVCGCSVMSNAYCCKWVALVAVLSLFSVTVMIAGCSPSGAAAEPIAKPPATPTEEPAIPSPPVERPNLGQTNPVGAKTSKALPSYVLPFEARPDPFAPPNPKPTDRLASAATPEAAEVKLVGLMKDDAGSTAVVDVDGKPFLVLAGARLQSASGAEDLHIVEIRESEIVVEQSGRQWIVPLPRP